MEKNYIQPSIKIKDLADDTVLMAASGNTLPIHKDETIDNSNDILAKPASGSSFWTEADER